MTSSAETPRRSDARRNREAILDVARELFADSPEFPLSEVARRAGVGQGTLYRHFHDRADLAAAILDEHVARFQHLATDHAGDPDAFFLLIRAIVEAMSRTHAVRELAQRDAAVGSALSDTQRRVAELIKRPLRDAKDAGLLRRDLTVEDVLLIIQMVRGAVDFVEDPAARAASASRALTLALDGATRSGDSRPPGGR
jgi:AcrR family transcriptional regulator